MTDKQPEALRLADALQQQAVWEGHYGPSYLRDLLPQAAAELRRLHQSEREGWRYADELDQQRKNDEALLRQALEALEFEASGWEDAPPVTRKAIAALRERLGEKT